MFENISVRSGSRFQVARDLYEDHPAAGSDDHDAEEAQVACIGHEEIQEPVRMVHEDPAYLD